MALERIVQYGFETNTSLEYGETSFGLNATDMGHYNGFANTGTHSLGYRPNKIWLNDPVGHEQISLNYYLYMGGFSSISLIGAFLGLRTNLQANISFRFNESTSELYAIDQNGVELAPRVSIYMTSFRLNNWMTIGITIKSGEDGWASLYIDGVLAMTITGHLLDTGTIREFATGNMVALIGGDDFAIDDISIDACTADEPDICPHSPRFYPLRPNSRGSSTDWLPIGTDDNYAAVNTINTSHVPPYIFTNQDGAKDLYGIPAPINDHVVAMIPVILIQGGSYTNDVEIQFVCRHFDTEEIRPAQTVPFSLDIFWERFEDSPDGLEWTTGIAGESEYGFQVSITPKA